MGANGSIRSIGTGSRWTPSTRSFTSTRRPAAWGSIPGSTRTRTSSRISPSVAIWPNSPRSAATRCSTSSRRTSIDSGKAGIGSATRIPSIPSTSIASSPTGTEAGSARICRSAPVTVPRSSATSTTHYELPPQPLHLSPEQAAERARVYKSLHERALGGSHVAPSHPARPSGGKRVTVKLSKVTAEDIGTRRGAPPAEN